MQGRRATWLLNVEEGASAGRGGWANKCGKEGKGWGRGWAGGAHRGTSLFHRSRLPWRSVPDRHFVACLQQVSGLPAHASGSIPPFVVSMLTFLGPLFGGR